MLGRLLKLVICLALALGLIAGCGKASGPTVISLTVTDKVSDKTKEPGPPVAQFNTQTTRFYAVAKVNGAQKDTKVKARWFLGDKLIDEAEVAFEKPGDRWVAFSLTTADGKPFPVGGYKVEVFLDGTAGPHMNFKVE